jgi:periplasmic divalent cation tolerance protein
MTNTRIVLTTAGSQEEARRLARELVERRMAACVNIVSGIQSVYRWEGKVEEAQEWLLIVKTTSGQYAALAESIRELHSYDVAECLCLEIEAGSPAYLRWVAESTSID